MFDGISCGQLALERAGFKVKKYYSSEIDEYAIKATQKNYPNTIQIGDIQNISYDNGVLKNNDAIYNSGKIDLLMGGSPCQDLSNYKYDRGDVKGLKGDKSRLFYHYVRLLREVKPTYFLLENVASMEQQWADIISEELGVEPILIDSNLVCGADRKRLYWTNIDVKDLPKDKGIILKDICLEVEDVPAKYWYDKPFIYNGDDKKVQCTLGINGHRHLKEVYNLNGKCNTLLCDGDGGNRQKKVYQDGRCRKLMPVEYERLQTLPDNYTYGLSDSRRYSAIGNGWTVDVIAHILSFMEF